VPMS